MELYWTRIVPAHRFGKQFPGCVLAAERVLETMTPCAAALSRSRRTNIVSEIVMADAVAIKVDRGPSVSYAAQVAEQRSLAQGGQLEGAITNLLQLEKTARLVCTRYLSACAGAVTYSQSLRPTRTPQSGDVGGTTELCVAMVEFCYEAKDFPRLNETITMLTKRRAQIKEAVGAMVRKGAEYLDDVADEATKLSLIETLRAVSEGKMFVEVDDSPTPLAAPSRMGQPHSDGCGCPSYWATFLARVYRALVHPAYSLLAYICRWSARD